MSHDYEVFESVWNDPGERERLKREVLDQGYSLGICSDETGNCFAVIPGSWR